MGVYIVVGGSSGIGMSLLEILYKRKDTLYNFDIKKPNIETKNMADFIKVDLRKIDEVTKEVNRVFKKHDSIIDGVAIVAGVGYVTKLEDLNPQKFTEEVELNLHIVYNFIYSCYSKMKEHTSIVTVSSIGSLGGTNVSLAYATAKAAIIGLTKQLAFELAPKKIRVNCVVPGPVNTSMANDLTTSTERRLLKTLTPLSKLAEPYDIANSISFLLTETHSRHITGQTITVDGGLSMAFKPYI